MRDALRLVREALDDCFIALSYTDTDLEPEMYTFLSEAEVAIELAQQLLQGTDV